MREKACKMERMGQGPIRLPKAPKRSTGTKVSWIGRLTHPLVFFGGALLVCESLLGTALLRSKSDDTIIKLSLVMAGVIISVMALVAFFGFYKAQAPYA